MHVFISGGAKNGKSFYAQQEAKRQAEEKKVPLYYIATMIPTDEEDRERIKRHVLEREGWGFITIEQGRDICKVLQQADPDGVFLLDSVTALLSNEMFPPGEAPDLQAPRRVRAELVKLAEAAGNIIFVSDTVCSDALQYDKLTESYREGLADCGRALAHKCDKVLEVCFGSCISFKEMRRS